METLQSREQRRATPTDEIRCLLALLFAALFLSLSPSSFSFSPPSFLTEIKKTHSSLGLRAARETERAWKGKAELGILAPVF